MKGLEYYWYNKSLLGLLLLPASWLFLLIVWLRRSFYRKGLFAVHTLDVPVIIVGNISVGGTGKTPMVIWLVRWLQAAGYKPGIVSRGYGGRARKWPQQVRPDSDPRAVGDEAVLIARHCRCPMAAGPDRVAAGLALIEHANVDIIVSDDGLQHYALDRAIEIVMIDGERRFGNSRVLPAGPLRESRARLGSVDFVIANGIAGRGEYAMQLEITDVRMVGQPERRRALQDFTRQPVHALCGIGNPQRFFRQLRSRGLNIIEHAFPDHYAYKPADLAFGDEYAVLMTEKDAVKCEAFANERFWFVPVQARLDERFETILRKRLRSLDG